MSYDTNTKISNETLIVVLHLSGPQNFTAELNLTSDRKTLRLIFRYNSNIWYQVYQITDKKTYNLYRFKYYLAKLVRVKSWTQKINNVIVTGVFHLCGPWYNNILF